MEQDDKIRRAFGYGRVSTIKQKNSGLSINDQKERLASYCEVNHFNLGDRLIMDEAVSGAKPIGDRPEAAKMIAALRPGDVVVVYSMDRAFRNTKDMLEFLEWCEKYKIGLHIVRFMGANTVDLLSPFGKLVGTILAAVAEMERRNISERITRMHAQRKKEGRAPTGDHMPIGTKKVWHNQKQHWVVADDPEALRVMNDIYEWYTVRKMSMDHIRQHLCYVLKLPNKWTSARADRGKPIWRESQITAWIKAEARRRKEQASERVRPVAQPATGAAEGSDLLAERLDPPSQAHVEGERVAVGDVLVPDRDAAAMDLRGGLVAHPDREHDPEDWRRLIEPVGP